MWVHHRRGHPEKCITYSHPCQVQAGVTEMRYKESEKSYTSREWDQTRVRDEGPNRIN